MFFFFQYNDLIFFSGNRLIMSLKRCFFGTWSVPRKGHVHFKACKEVFCQATMVLFIQPNFRKVIYRIENYFFLQLYFLLSSVRFRVNFWTFLCYYPVIHDNISLKYFVHRRGDLFLSCYSFLSLPDQNIKNCAVYTSDIRT